jgi:hypothetical protein
MQRKYNELVNIFCHGGKKYNPEKKVHKKRRKRKEYDARRKKKKPSCTDNTMSTNTSATQPAAQPKDNKWKKSPFVNDK